MVFIGLNDWGCEDAGLRSNDFFETPNIDRLAGRGCGLAKPTLERRSARRRVQLIPTGKLPARLYMIIWHEGAVSDGKDNRRLLEAKAQPNLPRKR